jgi:hypothetical protein
MGYLGMNGTGYDSAGRVHMLAGCDMAECGDPDLM